MSARPRRSDSSTGSVARGEIDWRAVVESLPDVVYALDLDGRFTYLNPRAHEVFGYSVEEGKAFIGRELMTILAPGSAAAVMGAIRNRAEHPLDRQVFRIEARHKDGTAIPLEVHGAPLRREGNKEIIPYCKAEPAKDRCY